MRKEELYRGIQIQDIVMSLDDIRYQLSPMIEKLAENKYCSSVRISIPCDYKVVTEIDKLVENLISYYQKELNDL